MVYYIGIQNCIMKSVRKKEKYSGYYSGYFFFYFKTGGIGMSRNISKRIDLYDLEAKISGCSRG